MTDSVTRGRGRPERSTLLTSVPRPRMARYGRVLVVGDGPARPSCGPVLQSAGFTVDQLCDGRLVVEAITRQRCDVVVIDHAMPSVDGIGILKAVREQDPDLPVVLTTGSGDLASAAAAVEHGAFRYLLEPVEPATLVDAAERAVALRHLAAVRRRALEHYDHLTRQEDARTQLDVRLERAMTTLHMVYQPIVQWSSRQVFAYEALVRTEEPSLRDPRDLLTAAESLGRLFDLGRAIRRRVATAVASGACTVPVFVNLHACDLEDEDLFSPAAPLSRVASRVVLEITERASLAQTPGVSSRLQALRALGYRLAVDDLGVGYSGLAWLAQINPDVVKLDMSLTRRVDAEPTKQRLVESMVGLCRELGALTVVEGVETPAERDTLVALGCDLLQGNLFAEPARGFSPVGWPPRDRLSRPAWLPQINFTFGRRRASVA